jgi:MYXO-CTERM domain-containing protein
VRSALRPFLLSALSALLLAAAAPPAAASPASEAEARALDEARAARGRWCPPTGCAGSQGSSLASLGGFAAATLGALALARRRAS